MNAVEFIKQYGWDDARVCILNCACPEDRWLMRHGELISDDDFDELKQLVDAWELVEERGGLSEAKAYLKTRHIFEMDALDIKLSIAIELVESVNENTMDI